MNKKVILIFILLIVLTAGCVDRNNAIKVCHDKGLQYTGKILNCNIECVNVTSGEIHTYKGDCKVIVQWNKQP